MWAIIGLGNPGKRYSHTRHNAGFMVIEESWTPFTLKEYPLYLAARGSIGGEEVLLIEPLTFMNNSGLAVRELMRKHNIPPERLIVIHDDIDMETGRLKIRKGGSSGGHRGIESVIAETGARDFIRIKIGIGRDEDMEPEEYVLRKFKKEEKPVIEETVETAVEAVAFILKEGLQPAMNRYNRKAPL